MKKAIEKLKMLEEAAHLLRKGISHVIGALENEEEDLKKITSPPKLAPMRTRAA